MAQVTLIVNGRPYDLACDDGQEERVKALGEYINARLKMISESGAAVSEHHLLVLTALVLADEIKELRDNGVQVEGYREASSQDQQEEVSQLIDQIAGRIETLSEKISNTGEAA